ncbi:PriCT-2 domain-containing protein [Leyella stercorea]|uniref:PriCT-2 domain-containing protein n=1 Tax=Leyella stercorea TaxID=363265 RepID=UPI001F19E019|nr:PriCT-2 domain-containing protein [Leyella stercorea]
MKTFSPEEWENVPSKNNTKDCNTSNVPFADSNTIEDTRAKVERVLSLIEQKGIDITNGYANWLKVGFALTSEFQEAGRGFFHRVSRQNTEYKASDTDKQYNKCLHMGMAYLLPHFFRWRKMLV